jgi:hypothetical protein
MSSYTPSGLPFESRQYRCERHPTCEDPSRCSTCEYNRRQRQLDRERGETAGSIIDQATRDYSSGIYGCGYRDLQQDLSRTRSNYYGELRSSARDALYGDSGGTDGSPYSSYEYRGYRDTGYGGAYPTRSTCFRDPFESSRYGAPNRYGNRYADFRYDNSTGSNPTTVRYADRPPPDDRDLDSMRSRTRRNGLSGNSGGGYNASQYTQQ